MWTNDNFNGKGVFSWNDGTKYDGEFKQNKFHGTGNFHWNNGTKFEGKWYLTVWDNITNTNQDRNED